MLAMISSRNLASTPVLSAGVVSAETPSSAHSACCGSTRRAVALLSDWSKVYKDDSRPISGRSVTEVDVDGTMLDVESTFCSLGYKLCCGGGCDRAIATRCCVAWRKFRKLLPVLITRHLSPRIQSKVYEACIRLATHHCSKTWRPKDHELRQLRNNNRAMIRWICGIKDRMKHPQLHHYWNLASRTFHWSFAVGVSDGMVMYNGSRRVSVLSQTFHFLALESKELRPQKTWSECVKTDVDRCGLTGVDPLD